jgi:hypothetical protein
MHLAKCDIEYSTIADFCIDKLVLIIHAITNPKEIIIRGISLISVGNINILLVNNIIHLIDLPAIIDIEPRSIVGTIIFKFSLILVNELDKFGPHRTTNLNRVE